MNAKELLAKLSIKHNGDWGRIYEDVNSKNLDGLEDIELPNVNYITILDEDYPQRLKESYRPPLVLWYQGDISLLKEKLVGVVTTEKYNPLIEDELNNDILISRKYIYHYHHKLVLVTNEYTDETKQADLVISEFPFNVPKSKETCINNAIRVGQLATKIIVFSAKKRSGQLIPIHTAIENNKEIYVLPQPYDSELANNDLIKEGAYLITKIEDLQ